MTESGMYGFFLRSPTRKNRPLRLSLLCISAGISPLSFFSASFFSRGAPLLYNMQKNLVFGQENRPDFSRRQQISVQLFNISLSRIIFQFQFFRVITDAKLIHIFPTGIIQITLCDTSLLIIKHPRICWNPQNRRRCS